MTKIAQMIHNHAMATALHPQATPETKQACAALCARLAAGVRSYDAVTEVAGLSKSAAAGSQGRMFYGAILAQALRAGA